MRLSWVVCSLLLLLASSEAISVHDRVRSDGMLRRARGLSHKKSDDRAEPALLQVAASQKTSAAVEAEAKEVGSFIAIGIVLLVISLAYQGVKWYRQRAANAASLDKYKTDTVPRVVCEARLQGYALVRSLQLQTEIAAGIVSSPAVCGGDRDDEERAFEVPEGMCERLNALEGRMEASEMLYHLQVSMGRIAKLSADTDFESSVTQFTTLVGVLMGDTMERVRRLEENALVVDAGMVPFVCPPRATCREVVASTERMRRLVDELLTEARQANEACTAAKDDVSSMFMTQLLDLHERLGMAGPVGGVDGIDEAGEPSVMDGIFSSMDTFKAAMTARGEAASSPPSRALGQGSVAPFPGHSVVDSVFSTLVALGTYDLKENAPAQDVDALGLDFGWNFQWLAGGGVALTLALLSSLGQYFLVDRKFSIDAADARQFACSEIQRLSGAATAQHDATRSLTTLLRALFQGVPATAPATAPGAGSGPHVVGGGDAVVDGDEQGDVVGQVDGGPSPQPEAMGGSEMDVEVDGHGGAMPLPPRAPRSSGHTLMDQRLPADVHAAIVHSYLYDDSAIVERVAAEYRPFVRLVVSLLRHTDLDERFKMRILHSRRAGHVFEALLSFIESSSRSYMQRVQKEARDFHCPQLDLDELDFQSFWSQKEATRREAEVRERDAEAREEERRRASDDAVGDVVGDASDDASALPPPPPPPPPPLTRSNGFRNARVPDPATSLLGPDAPRVCSVRSYAYMQLALLMVASGVDISDKAKLCGSVVKDAYKGGYLNTDVSSVADRLAAVEGEHCAQQVVAIKRALKLSFDRRAAAGATMDRDYKVEAKATAVQALMNAVVLGGANGLAQATAHAVAALVREGAVEDTATDKGAWAQAWMALHAPETLEALSQSRYENALDSVDAHDALEVCVGLEDLPVYLQQWSASMFGSHRWFVDVLRILAPDEVKTSILEMQKRRAQGLGATPAPAPTTPPTPPPTTPTTPPPPPPTDQP